MDIEADFEYARGELRSHWLRTRAWVHALWLSLGLAGLVIALASHPVSASHGFLAALSLLLLGTHGQSLERRLRQLNTSTELSLRFTDVGLSWRNQFVSHQVRWPAVRRVRRSRGWLVFEGTRGVDDVVFPARALSEVQIEELTKWLTAQKLMR
ncbi:YcxB family protein [Streptacidiphilus rugosus]|uniref:YcxB family protein n=1 Tax=Streptacidiphilus rugosus TaxID=405783 RepID=UPI0005651586|nr:YcxB family protein [Streptacidiphilus rugosus]